MPSVLTSPHAALSWLGDGSLFRGVEVLVAAACTLGVYSILYRENTVFRFFEHFYVGLAMGYMIFVAWAQVLEPKWWTPMVHEMKWTWALALPAGLLFYLIYSKRYVWMSRLIIMTSLGVASGMVFYSLANAVMPQVWAAVDRPIWSKGAVQVSNLISAVTLLTVLVYFFFSFEQKSRAVRGAAVTGRWLMMVAFGAMFGATVMARMSLLIGRLQFLLGDLLKVLPK